MTFSSIPWARLRQRAGGIAFALVLNAILLLGLFTLSPSFEPKKVEDRLPVTFDVETGTKTEQEQKRAPKAEKREQDEASPPKQSEAVVRPPRPTEQPVEEPPAPFPFLTMSRRFWWGETVSDADSGGGVLGWGALYALWGE